MAYRYRTVGRYIEVGRYGPDGQWVADSKYDRGRAFTKQKDAEDQAAARAHLLNNCGAVTCPQ